MESKYANLTIEEKYELLTKDFLERDGDTFVKIRTSDRLGWEKTLPEDSAYSAMLLNPKSDRELYNNAVELARNVILAMDAPFRVNVRVNPANCWTDAHSVYVATKVFDEAEMPLGKRLDVFLGQAVHEGGHLLYTDFSALRKIELEIINDLQNFLEDERIERELGEDKPGLANYLKATKYYYFGKYQEKLEDTVKQNAFTQLFNAIISIVRYPASLSPLAVLSFADELLQVRDILTPYPTSTEECIEKATEIYELIKKSIEQNQNNPNFGLPMPGAGSPQDNQQQSSDGSGESGQKNESKSKSSSNSSQNKSQDNSQTENSSGSSRENQKDDDSENENQVGNSSDNTKEESQKGNKSEGADKETQGNGNPENQEENRKGENKSKSTKENAPDNSPEKTGAKSKSKNPDKNSQEKDEPKDSEENAGNDGKSDKSQEDTSGKPSQEAAPEPSPEPLTDEEIHQILQDVIDAMRVLSQDPNNPEEKKNPLKRSDVAKALLKCECILAQECEKELEIGKYENSVILKPEENKRKYNESLARVRKYIPAVAQALKCNGTEYKFSVTGMRNGLLDTNKLTEARQGVQNVYIKTGKVKCDKVNVALIIDESGSMSGDREEKARDTAVLINEAVGKIKNVNLFIYGYTSGHRNLTLFAYKEANESLKKYTLGSISSYDSTPTAPAILEAAYRIRKRFKEPTLMFVMSDGGADGGVRMVREAKDAVKKLDFDILGISISSSLTKSDLSMMYDHYIVMNSIADLARDLGKTVKKAILGKAKKHIC